MIRKIILLSVLIMMTNAYAQDRSEFLYHKEFIALVGNSYEETPEPEPCAGQEIYLLLKFNTKKVSITQKAISSCGEENIEHEFYYKWKLLPNNELKFFSNPNDIKYTYLENLYLEVKGSNILGSIIYPNSQKSLFTFLIYQNKR